MLVEKIHSYVCFDNSLAVTDCFVSAHETVFI